MCTSLECVESVLADNWKCKAKDMMCTLVLIVTELGSLNCSNSSTSLFECVVCLNNLS